jgi:hypothetical protein
LFLLVFGVIGFGLTIYSDVNLSNGVREGARNAVVANYNGGNAACTGSSADMVACFVKNDTSLKSASTYVMVQFPATYVVGQPILVCAIYPMTDIGGIMGPFLSGRYLHAKTTMRLEQAPNGPATPPLHQDTPLPSGQNWSFCT